MIYKNFLVLLIYLISINYLYADAGYLASISSGPSPVISYNTHPNIEMSAEEVVIMIYKGYDEDLSEDLPIYSAEVFTSFLFTNTGEADRVLMAVPLEVITPFTSYLWRYEGEDSTLGTPVVKVDGQPVEVKLIFGSYLWDDLTEKEWKFVQESLGPVFDRSPHAGQALFFRNFRVNFEDEETVDFSLEILSPRIALACWEVEFTPGEQRIVEYQDDYEMTSDYEYEFFRMTYPLFTGATWRGNIGSGKISVMLADDISSDELLYYVGIGLPHPTIVNDGILDLKNYLSLLEDPEISSMTELDGVSYHYGIQWEFSDYKPLPADFSFKNYYPDIGDLGVSYQLEYIENPEKPDLYLAMPWIKSKIYICMGNIPLKYFRVLNIEGVKVYREPEENEENFICTIFPKSSVTVLEMQDRWINGEIYDTETELIFQGWIPMYYYDQDGLLNLNLMPSL